MLDFFVNIYFYFFSFFFFNIRNSRIRPHLHYICYCLDFRVHNLNVLLVIKSLRVAQPIPALRNATHELSNVPHPSIPRLTRFRVYPVPNHLLKRRRVAILNPCICIKPTKVRPSCKHEVRKNINNPSRLKRS